MPAFETELKLAATPRTLARLAADPLLGRPQGSPQHLLAVYYDTSRHALWKRRLTLRLRRERGRWWQTVKGGGSVEAGLHRREEFTRRATGPEPDLGLLGASEIEKSVAAAARRARLRPAFRIEIERDRRLLAPAPGVAIEASLDRGRIHGGESRAAVCELELELKRGPASSLYELARQIAARYPVRLEHRSKAERGFEAIGALRPAPVRGNLRVIRRGMSAAEAFSAACTSCLNHLQANQRGVIRGAHAEYLHQARVALRRLRSVLDAFGPLLRTESAAPRVKALRRLTQMLGPARDWDVFAADTLAPILRQFPGHRGLAALARGCGRRREAANRAARRALSGRRAQALLIDVAAWLASRSWVAAASAESRQAWKGAARPYAAAVLDRYHRRMLKRGRGIRSASLARLHRLRIAAKRLRYAAGFFAPLFPRARARALLRALNELQDALGAINDGAIAPELIAAASAAARGPLRAEARAVVGHWNAVALKERREGLRRLWKAVRRREPFWQ
jgi:triphosphatase